MKKLECRIWESAEIDLDKQTLRSTTCNLQLLPVITPCLKT